MLVQAVQRCTLNMILTQTECYQWERAPAGEPCAHLVPVRLLRQHLIQL